MVKLNAFALPIHSLFRLISYFDSFSISQEFRLLTLSSERGGCETDKTNDCVQVNHYSMMTGQFSISFFITFVYYGLQSILVASTTSDSINNSDYSGSEHATLQDLQP